MIRPYLSDSIRPAAFCAATTAEACRWCCCTCPPRLRCNVGRHSRRSFEPGRHTRPDRLGYGFLRRLRPWALSLEQYAHATIDGLKAAGMQGPIDLLGIHTGSIEAIEIRASAGFSGAPAGGGRHGRCLPAEEQQTTASRNTASSLWNPATEGGPFARRVARRACIPRAAL